LRLSDDVDVKMHRANAGLTGHLVLLSQKVAGVFDDESATQEIHARGICDG
jgi:hypothetical protein